MIGRAVWFALLAALALLTGFLQLDMRRRSAPHLAAMVPEPRYGALFLRRSTPNETLLQLGPGVLEGPDETGRATLVAIIVGSERWHPLFLRRGAQVMPPAAFADIAARSLRRGAPFECNDLRSSLKLLAQRDAASSERLAAAVAGRCPDEGPAGPRRL